MEKITKTHHQWITGSRDRGIAGSRGVIVAELRRRFRMQVDFFFAIRQHLFSNSTFQIPAAPFRTSSDGIEYLGRVGRSRRRVAHIPIRYPSHTSVKRYQQTRRDSRPNKNRCGISPSSVIESPPARRFLAERHICFFSTLTRLAQRTVEICSAPF